MKNPIKITKKQFMLRRFPPQTRFIVTRKWNFFSYLKNCSIFGWNLGVSELFFVTKLLLTLFKNHFEKKKKLSQLKKKLGQSEKKIGSDLSLQKNP